MGYYSQHEETMKTVIQSQAGAGEESTNIIAALRDLVQREGVGVFGCGLWPRLLKGAASGAITFTIFEVSRNLLS